jgi:lipid-binding SYLF domain-containing protein
MTLRAFVIGLMLSSVALAAPAYVDRLETSARVIGEIMDAPDNSIPQDLLQRAECVVVLPGVKRGAFIFGGRYGRGFLTCRNTSGVGWTGPAAIRLEGFNFGAQIGGSESDVVMLVMNKRGMQRLMTSRFTIGADASAAAGPVGRTVAAQTDAMLTAEILTYSRSRGIFAGIALDGATLRQDLDVNRNLYGQRYTSREIVEGEMAPPEPANSLIAILNRYSSRSGR